jgi:hypothetical protein
MGRPYTYLFLQVTKVHHVIVYTYQHAAPLRVRLAFGANLEDSEHESVGAQRAAPDAIHITYSGDN